MRVLVTGGRGMLGGAVVGALLGRGDSVTAFQRNPSGSAAGSATGTATGEGDGPPNGRPPVGSFSERLGDVSDAAAVRAAVAEVAPEGIVHLAAKVSVTGPIAEFVRVNVGGTQNVLAAAREAGAGVVHVSSPAVAHTGTSIVGAAAEPADPFRTSGPYARSKALAECHALAADDLDVVVVRPHLVWGPGDTQLVGRIVERARAGRLALVGPATALIDTTYVSNAADAIVAALDRTRTLRGRAFVVSNGQPRPVAELIARICSAAGVRPPRVHVPYAIAYAGGAAVESVWSVLGRQDDPPMTRFLAQNLATAHWFDQREAHAALGWRPAVDLDEGFRRLADWYA
jgi:2-alkyl-3-oxoalkanoate reductase